ncbi:hypothetical protein M5K25_002714 [Dendrobium thyrsiflorum]|uniref:Uncharacterized protein n=1 Tax=Dendrobium thyrsiflorum TaxID=117978 RepID=A0ABD0VNF2_DENTH
MRRGRRRTGKSVGDGGRRRSTLKGESYPTASKLASVASDPKCRSFRCSDRNRTSSKELSRTAMKGGSTEEAHAREKVTSTAGDLQLLLPIKM